MKKSLNVLIVEDSEDDALFLLMQLRKAGYDPVSERVQTREEMRAALAGRSWDIVISDYVMPRFSGLEALSVLNETGLDMPFIIVSGNIGEDIAVEAMRAGAHDYILKGRLARLVPAVERELRDAETRRERKRAEAALQETQERLMNTLESITDAFFTLDHEWRYAYVNIAAERLLRRSRDMLLGMNIWDERSPQALNPIISDEYHRAVQKGIPVAFEVFSPVLGQWMDIRAYPVKEGLAVYMRDITESKEADRNSAVNNSLLQLFAEKITKKEYLDAVVRLVAGWSSCTYAGIRLLEEEGKIPYVACVGFTPEFLESESPLSIKTDPCACTRVMAEKAEPQDLPGMTRSGSFYTNDSYSYIAALSEAERTRFQGACVKNGFQSIAVVPIRYQQKVYGAIHLADTRQDMVPLKKIEMLERMALIIGEAVYRFLVEEDLIRQREDLTRTNEQLRNLSAHIDAVREAERTSIAREIHDELGQVLTAIKMDVSRLRTRLAKTQRSLADEAGQTLQSIDVALQSVKKISSELRPGILDDIGLAEAIEWAVKDFQKRTGIRCTLSIHPESFTTDRTHSTALFRILQESLTNIIRHADASRVTISLLEKDQTIFFTVTDNGKGITQEDISAQHSFGLIGMRERVQFLGGEVKVTGRQNKGTTVAVLLPLSGRKPKADGLLREATRSEQPSRKDPQISAGILPAQGAENSDQNTHR